jgi:hypothetical protein
MAIMGRLALAPRYNFRWLRRLVLLVCVLGASSLLSGCGGGQSKQRSAAAARNAASVASALGLSSSSRSFRFTASLNYAGNKLPSAASSLSAKGVYHAPNGLSVSQNDGKIILELIRSDDGVDLRESPTKAYRHGPASLLDPWDVPRFLHELIPSKNAAIAIRAGRYTYEQGVEDRWLTGQPTTAPIGVVLTIRENKIVDFETTAGKPLLVRRSFQLSDFGTAETAHT